MRLPGVRIRHSLDKLSRVSLYGCGAVTDSDLAFLAHVPNLVELDVSLCAQVTGRLLVRGECCVVS